jgi:hypothetical protein
MGKDDSISILPQFDFADEFYNGKALVIKKEEVGFIDGSGKITRQLKYERRDLIFLKMPKVLLLYLIVKGLPRCNLRGNTDS